MKANFFKYIFILFIVGIIIYSIYAIYFKDKEKVQEEVVAEVEELETKKDIRLRNI